MLSVPDPAVEAAEDEAAPARPDDRRDEPDLLEWDVDAAASDERFDAFAAPAPAPVDPADVERQQVTAVLVVHDGVHWLPETVQALQRLQRQPDRLVVVDTGSSDGSASLTARLDPDAVVTLPPSTGFGAAVAAGLDAAGGGDDQGGAGDWVWLLHDDCAPRSDALRCLLECALRHPDAGVVGPKVVGWHRPEQLLEVGLTVSAGGRRHTGLERIELDQGQHDQVRRVLAAGSAGLLVRRDVWDELGGLDQALHLFRDDVDLGWRATNAGHEVLVCPQAVVRHAEAAAHGRRALGVPARGTHLLDRRNALHVVLANVTPARLPWAVLRVVVGGLLRAAGLLLGKAPAAAADELLALGDVLRHPGRLRQARQERRSLRRVPASSVRPLFPGPIRQLRGAADAMAGLVGSALTSDATSAGLAAHGPLLDMGERLAPDLVPPPESGLLRRVVRRPAVAMAAVLSVLALVAAVPLLGSGRLVGGALLPAPGSATALLADYAASWHDVGIGSPRAAPPYLAGVGLLGVVLLNSASAAVSWLLLAAVPLAGATAWFAVRRLVRGRWVRLWASVVWALLPVVTGAVAAGRLGTTVVCVVLPLLARSVGIALGRPHSLGPLRPAWTAGLLLGVCAAFAPLVWVVAAVLGLLSVAVVRSRGWAVRVAAVVLPTPLLLVPWTAALLRHPSLLLTEAGVPGPGLADPGLPPWQLLALHPGGPGSAPWWLLAAIPIAAAAALLSRRRRAAVAACWAVAGAGLVASAVLLRVPVTVPTVSGQLAGWPGPGVALAALGLVGATALGAEHAARVLPSAEFSWRQPAAAALAGLAVLGPLLGVGWWLGGGARDPLDRGSPTALPVYVVQEAVGREQPRTVVLRPDEGGTEIRYAVVRGAGPTLGAAETGPAASQYAGLDRVVGDVLSGRGGDEIAELTTYGVRYLHLPAPADPAVVEQIDALAGLQRVSSPQGGVLWRLDGVSARVTLRGAEGSAGAVEVVPAGPVRVDTTVAPAVSPRTLLLADAADAGWRASLDGAALRAVTVDGWAQGFLVPAGAGGRLVVDHHAPWRRVWLVGQLVAWVGAVALALPAVRRDPATVDDVGVDSDRPEPRRVPRHARTGPPRGQQ